MNRTCTACNAVKDVGEFVWATKVYDWCRDCRKVLVRRRAPKSEVKAMRAKARQLKEQKAYVPPRTLKPETVRLVRNMYAKGSGVTSIARGMNIGRTTVSDIVHNKTYRWVD